MYHSCFLLSCKECITHISVFSFFYSRRLKWFFLVFIWTDSSSGHVPYQAKSSLTALSSAQRREADVDISSEEQMETRSPSPPPDSPRPPSAASSTVPKPASFSSQDSRMSAFAKISQPPVNGVQQCLDRFSAVPTVASTAQHLRPEPNMDVDPAPPALPPKTRKAKLLEAPKISELSDWGDSDMDEETYSSSQEKHKVKKVRPLCWWIHCCTFYFTWVRVY